MFVARGRTITCLARAKIGGVRTPTGVEAQAGFQERYQRYYDRLLVQLSATEDTLSQESDRPFFVLGIYSVEEGINGFTQLSSAMDQLCYRLRQAECRCPPFTYQWLRYDDYPGGCFPTTSSGMAVIRPSAYPKTFP